MCRCTNCKPIAFSRLKATVLKIDNCDLEIGLRRKEICMKTSYYSMPSSEKQILWIP